MKNYKRLYGLIHHILIKEWDPIGIGDEPAAQDEYDAYIPGLIRLLMSGADKVKLQQYLHRTETLNMGLPGNDERNEAVAERLLTAYTERAHINAPGLRNYTRVRLLTDRYADQGVSAGAIGYIIEVYDEDAYEVEFSSEDGTTFAQIVAKRNEIETAEPG